MTEPTPPVAPAATPDPVEPKSLPDNLTEAVPAPPPNQIEDREQGLTSLIVWALLAVVFIGGLIIMAATWRQVALPSMPMFDLPEFELPQGRDDRASSTAPGQDNVMVAEGTPAPIHDVQGNPEPSAPAAGESKPNTVPPPPAGE